MSEPAPEDPHPRPAARRSARRWCSTASTSTSARASRWWSSAARAPASRCCSSASSACSAPTPAASRSTARTSLRRHGGASARRSTASSACCSRAARCSTACRSGRTSPSACWRRSGWTARAAKETALAKLAQVGLGADVGDLHPGGALGRHAEARRPGPRHRRRPGDHLLRRADHRPRPDHGRRDQRPDRQITRDAGVTALSITHDMASARKIANRIAMLYQGRIVWAGPVADIDQLRQRARRPVHPRPRRRPDPDGGARLMIGAAEPVGAAEVEDETRGADGVDRMSARSAAPPSRSGAAAAKAAATGTPSSRRAPPTRPPRGLGGKPRAAASRSPPLDGDSAAGVAARPPASPSSTASPAAASCRARPS